MANGIFIRDIYMRGDKLKHIQFSHNYSKLPFHWENTKALLLAVGRHKLKDLPGKFLDYDTHYIYIIEDETEDGYYSLDKLKDVLVLCLAHEDGTLFSTIRRWTPDKSEYYHKAVGEWFRLLKTQDDN